MTEPPEISSNNSDISGDVPVRIVQDIVGGSGGDKKEVENREVGNDVSVKNGGNGSSGLCFPPLV